VIVKSHIRIETAGPADADEVLRLLDQNQLPLDGLEDHLATTLVARQDGRIVGSATHAAIRLARDLQVPAIYLLTTTAERYFPRFGFERIERADVPPTVQTSIEFTSACPASATVMRKSL
jgi:amino-acid N-acetyltransferase